METRLFKAFCDKYNFSAKKGNRIFTLHEIWNYIESCYDTLHTVGDEYILNDIENQLRSKGVEL